MHTSTPAKPFTAMNVSPAPDAIAGIPRARATRIVRIPTIQHNVDATLTPLGTWVDEEFGVVIVMPSMVSEPQLHSQTEFRCACAITVLTTLVATLHT